MYRKSKKRKPNEMRRYNIYILVLQLIKYNGIWYIKNTKVKQTLLVDRIVMNVNKITENKET